MAFKGPFHFKQLYDSIKSAKLSWGAQWGWSEPWRCPISAARGLPVVGNVGLGAMLPHSWALLCCEAEGGWEVRLLGRGSSSVW